MVCTILASASPGRLALLREAGINPEVMVADVDENAIAASHAEVLAALAPLARGEATTCLLASAKARAIATKLDPTPETTVIIGCDSMLLIDDELQGKPHTMERARQRWLSQRGRQAQLVTGHCVIVSQGQHRQERSGASTTTLEFANLSDAEIDAYVATGEPLAVAGAFTLDGLGGAFVRHLDGDYHAVIGVSLALVRELLTEMGVFWPSLWSPQAR